MGPTAVAFVDGDAVAVAKVLRDFARTNPNLTIKGGLLGTTVLSAADAGALADVAPREVILAQLAGAFAAPLVKMAGLLQALPRNFAYGLSALLEKRSCRGAAGRRGPAAEARRRPRQPRPRHPRPRHRRRGTRGRGTAGRGTPSPKRRSPRRPRQKRLSKQKETSRWPPRKRSSTASPA